MRPERISNGNHVLWHVRAFSGGRHTLSQLLTSRLWTTDDLHCCRHLCFSSWFILHWLMTAELLWNKTTLILTWSFFSMIHSACNFDTHAQRIMHELTFVSSDLVLVHQTHPTPLWQSPIDRCGPAGSLMDADDAHFGVRSQVDCSSWSAGFNYTC